MRHQREGTTPFITEIMTFECGHSEKRTIRLDTLGFQVGLHDRCDGCGEKRKVTKEVANGHD